MAQLQYSRIDEYGFQRPDNFDYVNYGDFMSRYLRVLARRTKRWSELTPRDQNQKTNTLKRFVRKGIPLSKRAEIWMLISGAKEMANASKGNYKQLKRNIGNPSINEIIEIDLPRTFPENVYFSQENVLPRQLFHILATFAHQNNDVGYCQGLNYIAGLLLLATKNEEHTFWLLKCLIEMKLPAYYVRDMRGLLTDLDVLDALVKKRDPVLYRHLTQIVRMPWAVAVTKWFVCLYVEVLPTETVLRIWDCLFYEGSKVIFRVALTLMHLHRNEILACTELAETVDCFKRMGNSPKVIDCHEFIKNIFKVPGSLSNRELEDLRRMYAKNEKPKIL